ncbi:MAG TPA: arylsulfatase [Burkholderiales bacterium]|nr:arylsulfatase [Burkholderiales bacterium]
MGISRMAAACGLCLAACATAIAAAPTAARPPHIVYLVADDLGWKDVGFHGGAVRTPNLDKLAESGARLEKFYTLPWSTPTRAALLTGRYPMRYGLQTQSLLPWSEFGLPLGEFTLAQALRQAGYRTALVGKWQLGHFRREYWPTQRGFDSFYGSFNGGIDYFRKQAGTGEPDWHRNERLLAEPGYLTTLEGREAARIIQGHDPARPLFLYVSFQAPQAPWQAPKDYLEAYRDVGDENRRTYYAMISALDDAIGAVTAALERKGMAGDTLVVFHSDNGGAFPNRHATGDGDVAATVADNGPYADGKGGLHEGSMRVVALASWPGRIPAGIIAERIHVTDMYPTLLGLAGAKPDQARPLDGVDQWETISAGKPSPRKELLLDMEDTRGALLREGWKLIVHSRLPVRYELYNVQADPSEENNLADKEPQRVQELLARFNELAWEMAPSLYLEDAQKPRKHPTPFFLGENPIRP